MDKVMTLCYECQELVRDYYDVEVWPNVKRDSKCAMCGKPSNEHAADVCHVKTKERGT